jgi:uncharacterized protein (DUF362 family)
MTARAYLDALGPASYLQRIREGLEFVGAGALLSSESRVFLKPNLTFPTYRPGVMTSPEAVEAAIIALKDYTSTIYLGDSDSGGYNPFSMHKVYDEIGMYELGKRYGVRVVNLTDLPRRPVALGGGKPLSVDLPILLTDEIDQLITLPVPKIHMNTGVSLTFKNQWGCIPEPKDRLRLHPRFARVVFEVNRAIHARMAIVDGRWGLNVSGPMRGEPVDLNWLLVTDDLGAGARLCCELMQIPMRRAAHLRYAERRGAVPDRSDIELNQPLEPFLREPFRLQRRWTDYPGLFAFRSRPLAHLAYFSPLAGALHRLLYLFREPFYDYAEGKALDESPEDERPGAR